MTAERITVMIVEDEAPARAAMRGLVQADGEVELVGETWGRRAVDAIAGAHPDIVFLDVQMPGLDGFEILERLTLDPAPVVVFVTAYDQHAVRAFEVRALDYLVKPFTDERFREALERAKRRVRDRRQDLVEGRLLALVEGRLSAGEVRGGSDRIVLEDGGNTVVIPHASVTWIEASGPYVVIHAEGREHLVRRSLTSLEESLGPLGFARVHRSALVNLIHVREVHPLSHGDAEIILQDRARVKLSRSRRSDFEELLRQQWG